MMIKKLRWPLAIVFLALLAIGILLVSQQSIPPQSSPAGGGAAPVVEPATGGVYAEGLIGAFGRFNPVLDYANAVDRDVDRLLFSGLVRYDDRGLPVGDLADSWGISRDGLIYNFSIRPNAVWHDGQAVTSDDVIFTLELLRDELSPAPPDVKALWQQVQVLRLDEHTLQFRLPEAYAPFLDYLSFGVLPEHLLGDKSFEDIVNDRFNVNPVGCGPYRFDHLIVEDGQVKGVVLALFGDYYGKKPFIEQLAFHYYPDASTAYQAYQAGEILGLGSVPLDILPQVLKEARLNLHSGRLPAMTLILLNLDNPRLPFFQDVAVRRALMRGLNRQWMVDNLLGGQAILAEGPIFPGTWAYYDGLERLTFDAQQALDELKRAGYTLPAAGGEVREKDGIPLEFELLFPDDEAHAALAEAIQRDWSLLGVGVNLKAVPYDALVSDYLDSRAYQAALVDLNFSQAHDPDPYPFWHQAQLTGGQNYSMWNDRQASEYLEQARVTVDLAERVRLYRNFQVRFMEQLPALPLFYPVYSYALSVDVQGVSMGPLFEPADRFNTISNWFLLSRRAVGPTSAPQIIIPTNTP